VNAPTDAGAVLAALADPTRRDVLDAVAARSGAATATDLAAELPVTRQAIAKHLGVLRNAGLVTMVRQGRETRYRVVAGSLRPASDWIQRTEASWARRVDRLQDHLAAQADPRAER
jgi:DNA-binding transcriptional ArsR family regulator